MKRTLLAGLGATITLALVGVGVSAAGAAETDNPNFVFAPYIADAETAAPVTGTIGFEQQVVGLPDINDYMVTYPVPAGATQGWVFVSPRGMESTPSAWNAKSYIDVTGGAEVLMPNLSLTNQATVGGGNPNGINAVRAVGGEYSIGIAFTKDNGVNLIPDSLYFGHITVTAGTGEWTYEPATGGGDPDPDPDPEPVEGSPATVDLAAEVATSPVVEGLLSLIAPTAATTTIGDPAIVDGKSTSTGTLGTFQVQDGRDVTKPGWTLTTTSVGDFVNGGTTIGKANLGLEPKYVSGVLATVGPTQVAGSAVYPSLFASLDAGISGTASLDADLTFVAPAGSPAGTYTSTLTLTLVSK